MVGPLGHPSYINPSLREYSRPRLQGTSKTINNKIMIVTSNTTTTQQPAKKVSTTERVMASTMSVDEYFDELIDKVREDYANL